MAGTLFDLWGIRRPDPPQTSELKKVEKSSSSSSTAREGGKEALSSTFPETCTEEEKPKRNNKETKKHLGTEAGPNAFSRLGSQQSKWSSWQSPLLSSQKAKLATKDNPSFITPPKTYSKRAQPASEQQRDRVVKKRHKLSSQTSQQLFLDFGQRNFEMKQCHTCGMIYAPGVSSDESHHASFCSQVSPTSSSSSKKSKVRLPKLKEEWIIRREGDAGCTITVDLNSNSACINKLLTFKRDTIDLEMGFLDTAEEQVNNSKSSRRMFARLSKEKEVIGIVVVEELRNEEHSMWRVDQERVEEVHVEGRCMGVLQIWVAQEWRRKGVASGLIACARSNFWYGIVVPRERVFFSQPTSQGLQLAMKHSPETSAANVYSLHSRVQKREQR